MSGFCLYLPGNWQLVILLHSRITGSLAQQLFFVSTSSHFPVINSCVPAKLLQSCPSLCDPMNCSPPGSSVSGLLQAGILEWVVMMSSRGSSRPGTEPASPMSSALAGGFCTTSATWGAHLTRKSAFYFRRQGHGLVYGFSMIT